MVAYIRTLEYGAISFRLYISYMYIIIGIKKMNKNLNFVNMFIKVISFIGIFLFPLAAHAATGSVYGNVKTFDLRDTRCDSEGASLSECYDRSRKASNYNTPTLALRDVFVELRRASNNSVLCSDYTDFSGFFSCNYSVSGNPNAYLRIIFKDQGGKFKLTEVTTTSQEPTQAYTNYPYDNGRPAFRLNGGSQGAGTDGSHSVVLYGDGASSKDMEYANAYQEARFAFLRFGQESVTQNYFDNVPSSDGRVSIIMARGFQNSLPAGKCCQNEEGYQWANPSSPQKEDTVDYSAVLINTDQVFYEFPYQSSAILHELVHLAVSRAQVKKFGYDQVAWAAFGTGDCNATFDIFSSNAKTCHTAAEAIAYALTAAMIWDEDMETGEAYLNDPTTDPSNPTRIILEPSNCNCGSNNGRNVINSIRYFWDLYDHNDEDSLSNCGEDNITKTFFEIIEHYTMRTDAVLDGSLRAIINPYLSGSSSDEAGVFDMAKVADYVTSGSPYANLLSNACEVPGDFTLNRCASSMEAGVFRSYRDQGIDPATLADGIIEAEVDQLLGMYCDM